MASLALAASTSPISLVGLADKQQGNVLKSKRTLKSRFPKQFSVGPDGYIADADFAQRFRALGVDVAIVATPVGELGRHLVASLNSGASCYCETPLFAQPNLASGLARSLDVKGHLPLFAMGSRRQLDLRYPVAKSLDFIGAPVQFRLQETFGSSAVDEWSFQRVRADHLSLAIRYCREHDCRFDIRGIELHASWEEGQSSMAVFQLGEGKELLSRVTRGPRELRSFEITGTEGRCDLEKKRCWDNSGETLGRLPEPSSAKAARELHMAEFLAKVSARYARGHSENSAKAELDDTLHLADLVAQACSTVSLPSV